MLCDIFLLLHHLSLLVCSSWVFALVSAWVWPWTSWDLCVPWGKFLHLWHHYFRWSSWSWKIYIVLELLVLLNQGASAVHFQDFNAEVLQCLTIPNVNANLSEKLSPSTTEDASSDTEGELRFFAGDWSHVHQCLPHANQKEKDLSCSLGHSPHSGYDIVLMAETIYSISAQHNLYSLIKKVLLDCVSGYSLFYVMNLKVLSSESVHLQCLSHPGGVVYMAAKKHYFGVGGGTRQFLSMIEKDGELVLLGWLYNSLVRTVVIDSLPLYSAFMCSCSISFLAVSCTTMLILNCFYIKVNLRLNYVNACYLCCLSFLSPHVLSCFIVKIHPWRFLYMAISQ